MEICAYWCALDFWVSGKNERDEMVKRPDKVALICAVLYWPWMVVVMFVALELGKACTTFPSLKGCLDTPIGVGLLVVAAFLPILAGFGFAVWSLWVKRGKRVLAMMGGTLNGVNVVLIWLAAMEGIGA